MKTLLRLIPPFPTLQGLFGTAIEDATYGGPINPSYSSEKAEQKGDTV
jgi:hypothetical protein